VGWDMKLTAHICLVLMLIIGALLLCSPICLMTGCLIKPNQKVCCNWENTKRKLYKNTFQEKLAILSEHSQVRVVLCVCVCAFVRACVCVRTRACTHMCERERESLLNYCIKMITGNIRFL
jgi:ABC-type spermidine/putrescine transport system permease subunit II